MNKTEALKKFEQIASEPKLSEFVDEVWGSLMCLYNTTTDFGDLDVRCELQDFLVSLYNEATGTGYISDIAHCVLGELGIGPSTVDLNMLSQSIDTDEIPKDEDECIRFLRKNPNLDFLDNISEAHLGIFARYLASLDFESDIPPYGVCIFDRPAWMSRDTWYAFIRQVSDDFLEVPDCVQDDLALVGFVPYPCEEGDGWYSCNDFDAWDKLCEQLSMAFLTRLWEERNASLKTPPSEAPSEAKAEEDTSRVAS